MTARDLFTQETEYPQGGIPRSEGEAATPGDGSGQATRSASTESSPPISSDASVSSRARVCGDCGRGEEKVGGFVACPLQPSWTWASPKTVCRVNPVSWIALNADQARKRAQAGIDQAVAHAERVKQGWSDAALAWIRSFALGHRGMRLTGYELVQMSARVGFGQPPTAQAWGGPIQRAARTGLIRKVGTVADPNPERHGSDVPLWEVA